MEIQEAYKQKRATQLKEWTAQINLLEARIENAGAEMAVKRAEALQELRARQRVASEKMLELEKSTGEAWVQVKEAADKIWDDLKKGVAYAHSKFK